MKNKIVLHNETLNSTPHFIFKLVVSKTPAKFPNKRSSFDFCSKNEKKLIDMRNKKSKN